MMCYVDPCGFYVVLYSFYVHGFIGFSYGLLCVSIGFMWPHVVSMYFFVALCGFMCFHVFLDCLRMVL